MRRPLLALLVLAACAQAPAPSWPSDPELARLADGVAVKRALPEGTVVAIEPCAQVAGRVRGFDSRVIDALVREALRQSRWLDFAAGVERGPAAATILLAHDADARTLTTSVVEGERAPVPLGAERWTDGNLGAAVDRLAVVTRKALGDPLDPVPAKVAQIYSAEPDTVLAGERAVDELARGEVTAARELVERALRGDPGATPVLATSAAAALEAGDAETAARVAAQTLRFLGNRTAPTTQHRLARVLLLARAAGAPAQAGTFDEQLLVLGDTGLRERPYDPHPRYTRALALNYLRRFAESAPELRALAARWPAVASVAYHLAFAELALGEPRKALAALDAARAVLPRDRVVLPRILALYHSGQVDALAGELASLADAAAHGRAPDRLHELQRVRASLAILTGRPDDAVVHLCEDLETLRQRPSQLDRHVLELVEAGEVLIQLGRARDLGSRLQAFEDLGFGSPALKQALAYLAGLISARESDTSTTTALATLEGARQQAWATLVRAEVHHERGELLEETRELATAIRITDAALVRAKLARALRALGRQDEARELLADLRRQLLDIDLRRPLNHPLLAPGRALAYVATENG